MDSVAGVVIGFGKKTRLKNVCMKSGKRFFFFLKKCINIGTILCWKRTEGAGRENVVPR